MVRNKFTAKYDFFGKPKFWGDDQKAHLLLLLKNWSNNLGLKIFCARISGSNQRQQIIKDSLNFLPGTLSRLFDTFALDKTGVQRKPAFPHMYNKNKNL